jgi:glycosyltransferase involved in cell wall biosynthesis
VIAGQGPLASWVNQQNLELDNKIVLLGHLDKRFLAKLYANADLYVHPNHREPFGISPLEAMASELPVIAPNRGGILSYASDENAWLVEPNAAGFADAVLRATDDHESCKRKVQNAVGTVRKHSSKNATRALFDTYDLMHDRFTDHQHLFRK